MDAMIERLADYAVGLRYEELPGEALHECKRRLIDTLGCAVGGFDSQPAAIARAVARRASGEPPARILGTRETSTPELAAFANGVALDFHRETIVVKADASDEQTIEIALPEGAQVAKALLAVDESLGFSKVSL